VLYIKIAKFFNFPTNLKNSLVMSTYFPYSQLIANLRESFRQSMNRQPFFGDWSVGEAQASASESSLADISEIYY